jgi:glycogen synthase
MAHRVVHDEFVMAHKGRKVRIAYISYEYPPDSCNGGIATYLAQIVRIMTQRGHDVEVFASSPSRNGRFKAHGTLEHWIQEVSREDFGIVAGHAFAARHSEKPFDVLEGPEYNADARKAVELAPLVPLVVRMHTPSLMIAAMSAPEGFLPHYKNIKHQLRTTVASIVKGRPLQPISFNLPSIQLARKIDAVESDHARQAAIVAPPCQDLCAHAKSVWRIPEEAVRLAPYPYTPTKEFLDLQPRREGFTVGFVGRLEKRKGVETLAAAIPTVLNAVPRARFRLIGTFDYHASGTRYDQWIRGRLPEHAGQVEFTGKYPLERMAQAYDSLDVCAFPSIWENFPNVCLEAMSAARAVVASSAGGMSEILDHGRAGRLVPSGDSSALARGIIALLEAPAQRIALGKTARKRILETYNESVIGGMMESIYREAVDRKRMQRKSSTLPAFRLDGQLAHA